MPMIEVRSADLQKTADLIDSQIRQFKATKAGRDLSHNEQRALQTMEDELVATRERCEAALRAEELQEERARFNTMFSHPEQMFGMNTGDERRDATAARVAAGEGTPWPGQPSQPRGDAQAAERPGTSDAARRIIEQTHKRGLLPAHGAAIAERLVLTGDQESRDLASRWVQTTGSEHYLGAFLKLMGDPTRGHVLWSEEERQAYQRAQAVKKELRGMTTGAGSGGELLPLFLDPTVLLTSEGSNNPLRKIARVVQTTSSSWRGVTSSGVTAEWKEQATEAADASPRLDPAPVPVYFGDAFVPYSYEIEQDGLDFARELAAMLVDAADQLQAKAYTTGGGTTEPTGFVTALAGTASELPPHMAETFGSEDVYSVQNSLPARFQAGAQWVAGLPTINSIAQFETANGARVFPEVADGQLLRRPLNECSNMQDTNDVDAGETADNQILCYGNWFNFLIVDRLGTMIELVPQIFGENGRPTGQRGAFLWFRTGSDIVVPEAFRILNVSTSVS